MSIKLFDSKVDFNNINLSTEMVNHQHNDPFIPKCKQILEDIKYYLVTNNITNVLAARKNIEFKSCLERLDSLIYDRFGIPAKHIMDPHNVYAVIPNTFGKNTVLDGSRDILLEKLKKTNNGTLKIEKDEDGPMKYMAKALRDIDTVYSTKGVKIDLNDAYITGLPTDTKIFFLTDFCYIFFNIKLTIEEIIAIMLHEIGHAFTHIEYSYKVIAETSVIGETMIENISKKGKSVKETLLIVSEKLLGSDRAKELKDKNTNVIMVSLFNSIYVVNKQKHHETDSEQLADQFSGRFGMGGYLVSGLTKINSAMDVYTTTFLTMSRVLFITSLLAILLGGMLAIVPALILTVLSIMVRSVIESMSIVKGSTYDDNVQRLTRVKLEMIRRLRQCDLNKDELKQILTVIDNASSVIDNTRGIIEPLQDKILRILFKSRRDLHESKELEQIIEKVMENNLHVSAARLNTLF